LRKELVMNTDLHNRGAKRLGHCLRPGDVFAIVS
jgi:hypothetical protein